MDGNFEDLVKIQRQMANRLMEESSNDQKLNILDIVGALGGSKNKKVQVEQVILEAREHGIGEDECLRMIDELIDYGYLTQPEESYVQRA